MSEEVIGAKVHALDRRVSRLEETVAPIPKLQAKQHEHANKLQGHAGQLDAILGPKDSLLTQVGAMKGTIDLLDERLNRIDGGLDDIKDDVSKLVAATELRKVDAAGAWQMRATLAAALVAAISAVAVAIVQYSR